MLSIITETSWFSRVAEDLREEDEEESLPLPQLTVSEVKPEPPVLEDENSAVNPNDTSEHSIINTIEESSCRFFFANFEDCLAFTLNEVV